MTKKINIGILFGGRSCEHEVSVVSARSLLAAIDRNKYSVHLVAIDKSGHWHLGSAMEMLVQGKEVLGLASAQGQDQQLVNIDIHHNGNLSPLAPNANATPSLDIIFPVLHGTFGEDGTIQGVFEMAGIPYVGCGVAASAIAMDKALAKQIFDASGIPQAPCQIVTRLQWDQNQATVIDLVESSFSYPTFVKPANMGSSVGVNKAKDQQQLITAVIEALEYDNKIIIEKSMEDCQEVECAVLGNADPIASKVGEIIPGAEFYNYQTKYIDDKTDTLIPANISNQSTKRVQKLSIEAFKAIDGSGLARVDFFVHKESGEVYLNEINTLPGFTPISMYPKMWAASELPYDQLIDRLVQLGFEHHHARASLKRAF